MARAIWFVALVLLAATSGPAGEITAEKKVAIQELPDATNAEFSSEQLAFVMMDQVAAALRQSSGRLPDGAMQIIQEESKLFLHEYFVDQGVFKDVTYSIYDKYFTVEEIREWSAFYKTETGQKAIRLMPKIRKESMEAGPRLMNDILPQFRERLMQRFEEEHSDLM